MASTILARAALSSEFTCVKATVVQVFLWPRRPAWPSPCSCSREPHLPAQGGQEDHQLDGIHIVCSHHQLGLWVLHQDGDSVNPCSKDRWPLGGDTPFCQWRFSQPEPTTSSLPSSLVLLVGQLQQLSSSLAVQGPGELVNGRRHFQMLIENSPLLLQPNVGSGAI